MKKFIALFALVALVSANPVDDKAAKQAENHAFLTKIALECSKEIGFDINLALKLVVGDFTDRSAQAKCFMKCFFVKEGFMNEQNEPQKDFIVSSMMDSTTLSREKLTEIIDNCASIKNNDSCVYAYELLECFLTDKDVVAFRSQ